MNLNIPSISNIPRVLTNYLETKALAIHIDAIALEFHRGSRNRFLPICMNLQGSHLKKMTTHGANTITFNLQAKKSNHAKTAIQYP